MCGICGTLQLDLTRPATSTAVLRDMLNSIGHRGPDDEGIYRSGPVALGHKRLKIIDLSTGKQPISNEDGTVWVVYNGEIYNYKELRADLIRRGHRFQTATDTEVIVHLYEELGEECVAQFRGMFSFALWDDRNKTLLLARDRVGIKPLYYSTTRNSLVFASEIKAILEEPSVQSELDPALIDSFLTYFYIPGEQTLFRNVHKLNPGHYLTVKNGQIERKQYWDLKFHKVARTYDQAVEELDQLLSRTVRDHMISDVPVGVLLSGGVDSTAVLSFAVENTEKPISTFTVGFDSGCADERPYAKLAAQTFGVDNYDISITCRDFWDFLPKYVWHMEEPVCEPPAIALYYISRLAREHVTVLLSGEGGDEAFAGYQSYRNFALLERAKKWLGPLAGPVGSVISAGSGNNGSSRYRKYGRLMGTSLSNYYYSHSSAPYEFFNSHFNELYTEEFGNAVASDSRAWYSKACFERARELDTVDQMLYVDTKTWLPDDLLIKADKMTMANSLELRVPFLDHQVLEFAASLPSNFKLKNTTTKHILKRALAKRVPKRILDRKKTGFPVPYPNWLTGELRGDVSEILLDRATTARGYFKRATIEKMLNSPTSSTHAKELFSLVTLELWHRQFADARVNCACL